MGAIIALLIILTLFGVVGVFVYRKIQTMDPRNVDKSTSDHVAVAEDFLPFKTIRDGVIDLGNHDYRAVIECSSTNYDLKTEDEKWTIEGSFQRFLNSLNFPVTFYIQTRVIDNSDMLKKLEEQATDAVRRYPQMEGYAEAYLNSLANLSSYIGNNRQKKKYVIVPFNEAIGLDDLNDDEKYEYSLSELQSRVSMVAEALTSFGVKSTVLDTSGLAELIFAAYHKDNYGNFANIANGNYFNLIVSSKKNPLRDMSDKVRMDWILYEAQQRINHELLKPEVSLEERAAFVRMIENLSRLRDENREEQEVLDV